MKRECSQHNLSVLRVLRHRKKQGAKDQVGAALVLVLLVTAIVAALAVEFQYALTLSMARVGNRWHGAQAHQYLLGAESLAALVLEQDFEADAEIDDLNEEWAQEVPPFPTDHGFLEAKIEDGQSRLNINNLRKKAPIDENQPPSNDWERFTPMQRRFIRLLQSFNEDIEELEVSEQEAIAITEAVIDWLDEDDEPTGFGGAESLFYSNAEPPYQPANQFMNSVSELRLVQHITPQLYVLLEPYLVALPSETTMNLNTIPAKLMQTINDKENLQPLDANDVSDIITDRELQSFETVDLFNNNQIVESLLNNPDTEDASLGVRSDFFILHAKASVGEDQIRFLDSQLYRNEEGKTLAYNRRYTSY